MCWGKGEYGRLGNDGTTNKDHPVNVVDGDSSAVHLSGIIQVTAGVSHTCALKSNGEVLCWGFEYSGRLGNDASGAFAFKDHPVNVVDGNGSSDHLSGIVQISARGSHTCALNSDGEVLCWGRGIYGQLGDNRSGGSHYRDHPVNVVDGNGSSDHLSGIIQISLGGTHTCALKSSGEALCWGWEGFGRLGNDASEISIYKDYTEQFKFPMRFKWPLWERLRSPCLCGGWRW